MSKRSFGMTEGTPHSWADGIAKVVAAAIEAHEEEAGQQRLQTSQGREGRSCLVGLL